MRLPWKEGGKRSRLARLGKQLGLRIHNKEPHQGGQDPVFDGMSLLYISCAYAVLSSCMYI